MTTYPTMLGAALAAVLLFAPPITVLPAVGQEPGMEQYVGAPPEEFPTPAAAIEELKKRLAADDFDGIARLLGLDPKALAAADDMKGKFQAIRDMAAKLFRVDEEADQQIVVLGEEVWPFPFPLRKRDDGKWAFDTDAGLEEVVNRRIGENELEAINTLRAYVDAQKEYASEDRDEDGVLEFAQKLISTEGQTDGLYWPIEQGSGESPAGPFISEQQLGKAGQGDGYFGYRFRILRAQGDNIAGGRYDYVINGNMIGGFGLIAWPVKYAETGVNTFAVNQAGIVYEKDLGPKTEAVVREVVRFNPDDSWTVVTD
jgi:hypothetical protein